MQRHWVAVVPQERLAAERAYAHESLPLREPTTEPGTSEAEAKPGDSREGPAAGDRVALVAAADPPLLFGLGVAGRDGVRYTHRLLDEPLALDSSVAPRLTFQPGLTFGPGLTEVSAEEFDALTAGVGGRVDADRSDWFVMVALPIEAASRADAVREFWTYVEKLGPAELPAFVWPRGDELAMQAYLLGERVNLDPEEDEAGE